MLKQHSLELLHINELRTYIQSLVAGFLDLYFSQSISIY